MQQLRQTRDSGVKVWQWLITYFKCNEGNPIPDVWNVHWRCWRVMEKYKIVWLWCSSNVPNNQNKYLKHVQINCNRMWGNWIRLQSTSVLCLIDLRNLCGWRATTTLNKSVSHIHTDLNRAVASEYLFLFRIKRRASTSPQVQTHLIGKQ